MSAATAGIYLECLYTEADEALKNTFAPHLEVLRKAGFIDGIHYTPLLEYPKLTEDRLEHTDIFIILISADLLASEFMQSIKLQNILHRDEAHALELIPILLRECDLEHSIFDAFELLPTENKAVVSEHWHNPDQAFLAIGDELKIITQERRSTKTELEKDWAVTQGSRSLMTYDTFLEKHTDSKYSPIAQEEKDQIREEQLWVKVERDSNMSTLLNYLQKAPLQAYRDEALERIIALRQDEEIVWKDAKKNNELAFFMDYKRRFPKGAHRDQADFFIENFLLTPFDYNEKKLKTEGYYLQKLALEELSTKEYLSMDMIVQYTEYSRRVLKKMIGTLGGQASLLSMIAYGIVGIVVILMCLQYYFVPPSEITVPSLIRFIIPIVLSSLVATTILNVSNVIARDALICKEELDSLKRKKVMLQTAFILHDKRTISSLLKSLLEIEQRSSNIHKKQLRDYFGL